MQGTFHACTGSCHRCESLPTIPAVSVTTQELIRLLIFETTSNSPHCSGDTKVDPTNWSPPTGVSLDCPTWSLVLTHLANVLVMLRARNWLRVSRLPMNRFYLRWWWIIIQVLSNIFFIRRHQSWSSEFFSLKCALSQNISPGDYKFSGVYILGSRLRTTSELSLSTLHNISKKFDLILAICAPVLFLYLYCANVYVVSCTILLILVQSKTPMFYCPVRSWPCQRSITKLYRAPS